MTAPRTPRKAPAPKLAAVQPETAPVLTLMPPRTPQDRLGKLPRRVTVGIYLDDDTVAAVNAAAADLAGARERLDASRPRRLAEYRASGTPEDVINTEGIRADVEHTERAELGPLEDAATAALDAMDEATTWFTFRSLGRKAFKALLDAHPARDQDHDAAAAHTEGARAPYNLDTFPPALIQAACIEPVLDDADMAAIYDGDAWNDVEINTLLGYAQLAQSQAPTADPKRRQA